MKVLVKLDVHPYYPDVWFTNSYTLLRRQVLKFREDAPDDVYIGVVSRNETASQMVLGLLTDDRAVLVHELAHVVLNVFEAVGIDANTVTTEAFAYLQESLYRQCCQHLDRWALQPASAQPLEGV